MNDPKLFATTPAASPTVRLALARDVARALLTTLDPGKLATTAVTHLRSLVLADAASVQVWEAEDAGPRPLHGHPLPLPTEARPVDLLGPPPPESATYWLEDVDDEAPVAPLVRSLRQVGARHAVVAPLVGPERPIPFGLLVAWRLRSWPFERDDLAATEEIAGPLALALENARLHRDVARSLDELRAAQERLVRRERLAAVGTMAAVLAHEVRSPLAVCVNAVAGLRGGSAPEEDRATLLSILDEEMRRLELLVGDLLDFGRPEHRSFRDVDPAEVVSAAVESVRQDPRVPDKVVVRLELELPPGTTPTAWWDSRGIHQLVVNLVLNGAHAIAGAKREGVVRVRLEAPPPVGRAGFTLEVRDDGPGVPEEIRERMFEPFFTTRPMGTGLGLAVVRRVVEDHGGRVEVTEGPEGIGTVMRVRLPGPAGTGY
jgi:signal transduction histidine kinase